MTPMYYRNANAALLIFDITNYNTFVEMKGWIQELNRFVANNSRFFAVTLADLEFFIRIGM